MLRCSMGLVKNVFMCSNSDAIRLISQMTKRDKPSDSFVEHKGEGNVRQQRITLPLDAEGHIDWDAVSDKKRVAFVEAVTTDDHTLGALQLERKKAEGGGSLWVTPQHVKDALDIYATAEAFIIPKVVLKQSKGIVRITPEIASAAFVFTPEQKEQMGPCGAEWANQTFPEWLKKFLLEIGPGAKFFGLLVMITVAQTKAAVDMWRLESGQHGVSVAGEPTPEPAAASVPPNGKGNTEVIPVGNE